MGEIGAPLTSYRFTYLQVGRALAALAVLLMHASHFADTVATPIPRPIWDLLQFGYLGVDFFFVLSGFILSYSYAATARPATEFLLRRAIRIYTPYWPIALAMGMAAQLFGGLGLGLPWSWAETVTLLPISAPPVLSVAWTLQQELLFYISFSLLVPRFGFAALAIFWSICAVTGALSAAFGIELHGPRLLTFLFNPINLNFVFGVLAFLFVQRGARIGRLAACICLGLPVLLFALLRADPAFSFLIGSGLAVSLILAIQKEQSQGKPAGRGWLLLGAGSYAIYLAHIPMLILLSWIGKHLFGAMPWLLFLSVTCLLCTAGALIYHLAWEAPALRWANRRLAQTFIREIPADD